MFRTTSKNLERQDDNRVSYQSKMPLCKLVKVMKFNREREEEFANQFK
jgi:hypothetical protein